MDKWANKWAIEGCMRRRKPYVTFQFVILKIPSFMRVIGFSFIPNIRKIDNKVREKGGKKKMTMDEDDEVKSHIRLSSAQPFNYLCYVTAHVSVRLYS